MPADKPRANCQGDAPVHCLLCAVQYLQISPEPVGRADHNDMRGRVGEGGGGGGGELRVTLGEVEAALAVQNIAAA